MVPPTGEFLFVSLRTVGGDWQATRQPPVSTAPGRGGSKPPAAAQPLNIQRTAQLRQLREAKSLPYQAWAYELPYHHLQFAYLYNRPDLSLDFLDRHSIARYDE